MITVDIILFRAATEVLYIIHLSRQAETYADTGNFQFGSSLAGSVASGSEGSRTGSLGSFCFGSLHIRRSKFGIYIDYSARINLISYDI